MRITKVSVEKLFGIFDHEIPLNQDSRITIIHGPNGVGKTVLLNMLHGLFHYEYELLRETPFEQFHIEFENGEFITVRKEVEDEFDDTQYLTLLINYQDGTGKDHIPFRPSLLGTTDANLLELVEKLHPDLKSVYMVGLGVPYWASINEIPEIFTKEDMLRKYPSLHNELYGEIPDWFASIQQAASLKFVSTARLKSDVVEAQIIKFAIEFADSKMQQNEYISFPRSGYLFPSPPDAILDLSSNLKYKMLESQVTSEEFEKLKTEGFEDLNAEINALTVKLAKLDIEIAEFEDVLAEDTVINSSYVSSLLEEHRAEQMDEREAIHLKLERNIKRKDFALATILLLDLINERFLFKSLDLRDTDILPVGFFKFIADDGDNSFLSGAALSSGEQHLFILYYYLLFKVQPDTLVMIDEPELSMNVVWQRNFLKDLQRIIELRKFDVLVATHSPQIIHDKWDWMVALGEPEGES